jgi:hypothetical protein
VVNIPWECVITAPGCLPQLRQSLGQFRARPKRGRTRLAGPRQTVKSLRGGEIFAAAEKATGAVGKSVPAGIATIQGEWSSQSARLVVH